MRAPRVLSLPADHHYVRHALGPGARVLRDPPVPGAPRRVWWPSPAWEPTWIERHRAAFDLVHVHFGYEHRTVAQIRDWVRALRRLQVPLVVTVHDLDLPHTADQTDHRDATLARGGWRQSRGRDHTQVSPRPAHRRC